MRKIVVIQRRSCNRCEATFFSQTGRVSYPRGKESGELRTRTANAAAAAPPGLEAAIGSLSDASKAQLRAPLTAIRGLADLAAAVS